MDTLLKATLNSPFQILHWSRASALTYNSLTSNFLHPLPLCYLQSSRQVHIVDSSPKSKFFRPALSQISDLLSLAQRSLSYGKSHVTYWLLQHGKTLGLHTSETFWVFHRFPAHENLGLLLGRKHFIVQLLWPILYKHDLVNYAGLLQSIARIWSLNESFQLVCWTQKHGFIDQTL